MSAGMFHIRWMDIMMKILLPAGFIALKLTGSFIDFMLGLSNSNVEDEQNFKTAQVRDSWTSIQRCFDKCRPHNPRKDTSLNPL